MSEPVTRIFFVRHGDVRNPRRAIYGNLPYPLSPLGIEQIKKVAAFLGKKPVEAVYTSPIKRTGQSAEIIASQHNLKPIKEKLLIESEWWVPIQGTAWKEMDKKMGEPWRVYHEAPGSLKLDGVALKDIAARLEKFVQKAVAKHRGGTIVAVTHGDPLRALILKLQGKSYNDLHKIICRYGCTVEVVYKGKKFERLKFHSRGSRDLLYIK